MVAIDVVSSATSKKATARKATALHICMVPQPYERMKFKGINCLASRSFLKLLKAGISFVGSFYFLGGFRNL